MAVKKENLEIESALSRYRPIELITDNGFSIVRDETKESTTGIAFRFLVADPNGSAHTITVEISVQFENEIRLRSRGRITRESSFWVCCAERHLVQHLSEYGCVPSKASLEITQLTIDDWSLALYWGTHGEN